MENSPTTVVEVMPVACPSDKSAAAKDEAPPTRCEALSAWCLKNFLPLGLIFFLIIGAAYPPPGEYLSDTPMADICIAIIFVISGLKLETSEVSSALTAWKATLFGVLSILFITPCIGFLLVHVPMSKEFGFGLAIFSSMPTTLTSGVILTKLAEGNVALALLLTVVTNLLGVVSIPVVLPLILANNGGNTVSINAVKLLIKLSLIILLPLLVGKAFRYHPPVAVFVTKHKDRLKIFSAFCLILVPWMKISTSVDSLGQLSAGDVFGLLGCAVGMHVAFLVFNYGMSMHVLKLALKDSIAVVLMTSQKTLGAAVLVVDTLPEEAGEQGLIVIAIIVAHFSQILIDSVLVSRVAEFVHKDIAQEEDVPLTETETEQ